ncbi:MAG TPA: hypothetical protein VFS85_03080 [Dongiaceae bacterium]|jgi:hypothetical protein|nr:hypothetical protein [Dongiaceae bacterium]
MRPGRIGRKGQYHWIALGGAMLLAGACQSPSSIDGSASSGSAGRAGAQPAAPILSGDPASFIGLGGTELSRTLGEPKQVRKDEPAEIWQYSGADCVVDFYLYRGAGGLSVAYLEARDQTAAAAPTDRCVKSLLQSVSAGNQPKAL